jgi:hypothetical protein
LVGAKSTDVGCGSRPYSGSLTVMTDPTRRSDAAYRAATGLVTFLGIYQGAVPLVTRGLFGADQRFAPALGLAAPWWWMACIAIVVVTLIAVAFIDATRERRLRADRVVYDDGDRIGAVNATETSNANPSGSGYDSLASLVLLIGLYNGVAPFLARWVFGGSWLFTLTLRLDSPWWWITSLTVIAVTAVLLALIERAKQRLSGRGDHRSASGP